MLNGEADRRESCSLLELSHPNTQQYFIHLTAVPVLFLLYSTVFFIFILFTAAFCHLYFIQ